MMVILAECFCYRPQKPQDRYIYLMLENSKTRITAAVTLDGYFLDVKLGVELSHPNPHALLLTGINLIHVLRQWLKE